MLLWSEKNYVLLKLNLKQETNMKMNITAFITRCTSREMKLKPNQSKLVFIFLRNVFLDISEI